MTNIEDVLRKTDIAAEALNGALKGMEADMFELIKKVPEQDKAKVAEMQNLFTTAMQLARAGDQSGINELIKTFQNGSKSNEASV